MFHMTNRVLVTAVAGLTATAIWAGVVGKTMNVQIKAGAPARETPKSLGKVVATLPYGASVQILEKQDAWLKVSLPNGGAAWIHSTALTTDSIKVGAGTETAKAGASADEVALAGKGFNKEVEKSFRSKHANMEACFAQIDVMEKINIPQPEMLAFLKAGDVQPAPVSSKGGAK